jgi:DNA repair protein RecN (Recombination protein N)
MLRHLRVTNFSILSDVTLELGPGFNVLTGETGAGKSLVVEAVNLLRGGRASADIPRAGADEATVEAVFEVPADLERALGGSLATAGLPPLTDGELLVRRVIQRGGRSRTYLNGALTTAACLAEVGAVLVDLSGQHQHQGLVETRRHRPILDAFAGHETELAAMAVANAELGAIAAAIEELGSAEDLPQRVDYLRFQVAELEEARLRESEEDDLLQERARLAAVDRLRTATAEAEEHAYGGDGAAVDRLTGAITELERVAGIEPRLAEPLAQLAEARTLAEEAAAALRRYGKSLEADPERLAAVEERLALVRRLVRKHGGSVTAALARAIERGAELAALERRDERQNEMESARAAATAVAEAAAAALGASRRRAATRLATEVTGALAELGMGAAALTVAIEPAPLGPTGADHIELMLCANPGEEPRPLARIASGGELSRIMLALKRVLRRADEVGTYVFDEVDAGIGGQTAVVVGQKIRAIADVRQVLCVTHLAQIAAFADSHFRVEKSVVDGRTETAVTRLDKRDRRDEIARMLGGLRITPSTRAHADEMLRQASARA